MPSTMDTIEIKLSKTKIIFLTLGSIGFVLLGIWLWQLGGSQFSLDTLLTKLIGVLSISFFGMCGCYGFVKLFDNRPGLVINKSGILDNATAVGGGLISWRDISGFEVLQMNNQRFLLIFIHNPEEYMDRANSFKRFWMRMNFKMYGTPLSISSNSLTCNFDELIATLDGQLAKYEA
jgi:hypothetical protein